MADLDFGMDKKYFAVFAIIAVLFIGLEGAMMAPMFSVDGQGTREFSSFYDRLAVYGTDVTLGPPSDKTDWYFYTLSLGHLYEDKTINVEIDVQIGRLVTVITYHRGVSFFGNAQDESNVRMGDAIDGTLIKHGNVSTFTIQTPEKLTGSHPYIIMVAIIPMGYYGNFPVTQIFANLTYT